MVAGSGTGKIVIFELPVKLVWRKSLIVLGVMLYEISTILPFVPKLGCKVPPVTVK